MQRCTLAAIAALIFSSCNHLFYYPSKYIYSDPKRVNIKYENIRFKSRDGYKLAAWFFPAKPPVKGTIVQFHGNAENLTSHYRSLIWIAEHGYNLFSFDYKSYGQSAYEGALSPQLVQHDGIAAINYVRNQPAKKRGERLIVYGQSLGGIIAMESLLAMPERKGIFALVLESTFSSYQQIALDKLSDGWLTWPLQHLAYLLVSDKTAPGEKVHKISPIPILVIHGTKDHVVPIKFGRKIYKDALEPKFFWKVEGGRHINAHFVENGKYRDWLVTFFEELERTRELYD